MADTSRQQADRKEYGHRKNRPHSSKNQKPYQKKQSKGQGPKNFKKGPSRPQQKPAAKNPSGDYRPSKSAPEIDSDVTGKELENWTLRALRQLEAQNAETVAKHLVMVGRYLDIDPDFALEQALAASKRAGRIGLVREVVGIAAYAAENYELALRELRTHRRISGSTDHLALLVDCERALGRTDKALTLAQEALADPELAPAVRSEVAIVVSGIHQDAGQLGQAIKALEIPELNPKRGYDYSPRLFSTYSDLLAAAGRAKEATRWARLARMTEAALGQGDFVEPEIFDIFSEKDLLAPEEKSVDLKTAEEANSKPDKDSSKLAEEAEAETASKEAEELEAPAESQPEPASEIEKSPVTQEAEEAQKGPSEETQEEALFEMTESMTD